MNPDRNEFGPSTEQPPTTPAEELAAVAMAVALLEGADGWLALSMPYAHVARGQVRDAIDAVTAVGLAHYYRQVANGGTCDTCDGAHGTSDHVDLADFLPVP